MRWIFIVLIIETSLSGHSQSKIMHQEDSCVTTLRFITIDSSHSSYLLIHKRPVNNLLHYIRNCNFPFHPQGAFTDRGSDFIIPRPLTRIIYTNGENNFAFRFDDTGSHTTIEIYYDFDSSYQRFFTNEVNTGRQEASTITLNGKTCWVFPNWNGQLAGRIFLENNTFITYYTDNPALENELRETIGRFKWN